MAECALGKGADGRLNLNEYAHTPGTVQPPDRIGISMEGHAAIACGWP